MANKPVSLFYSHGELAKLSMKHELPRDAFPEDFENRVFEGYNERFVVYQKGIFAGTGDNREELRKDAGDYYGYSSVVVYRKPIAEKNLLAIMREAEFLENNPV